MYYGRTLIKISFRLRSYVTALSLLICYGADAQTVALWNLNGTTSGTGGIYNTVSVADFSPSLPSTSFNAGVEYFGQNGWPTGGYDSNMYLEFSLIPNSGYALNIASVNLKLRHSNTGPSGGSGPTRFSLRSSLDGFASDIASGAVTGSYVTHSISPGPTFSNVPTTITFRVYGYLAAIYSGGNNRFVFDNIDVDAIGLVLPVKIASFTTRTENEKVQINYELHNTSKGSESIVERSEPGGGYVQINSVIHTSDVAAVQQSHTDERLPAGASLLNYRLKIKSPDGSVTYSVISTARFGKSTHNLRAFSRNNTVTVTGDLPSDAEIKVVNSSGITVAGKRFQNSGGYQSIRITTAGDVHGVLYILITGKEGRQVVSTFAM